jgi:hypothetical protein
MTTAEVAEPARCPVCGARHAVLFVADPATGKAARQAVDAVRRELELPEDAVVVVDVFRAPDKAFKAGAFATPSLALEGPAGPHWIIGDFSDTDEVRRLLGRLTAG